MKTTHRAWMVAAAAAGALALAGNAQARSDVTWGIGVAAPGVTIGATNAPPVYYAPPVYVAPQPVYVAPRPVYMGAPYYVAPGYVYGPRWKKHWRHSDRHDRRGWRAGHRGWR